MSSTNRGYGRHKSDYYVTPVDEISKFFKAFEKVNQNWSKGKLILDPCAGGDNLHDMSYPAMLKKVGVLNNNIYTVDVRMDSRAENIRDNYLDLDFTNMFDVVITNPPFNLALPIIKKALNDTKRGGWVIMLQRLNFLGSIKRKLFWDNHKPWYIFVHHKRMSFTDNGNTDSIEYAHFVWKKDYEPTSSKLLVI